MRNLLAYAGMNGHRVVFLATAFAQNNAAAGRRQ